MTTPEMIITVELRHLSGFATNIRAIGGNLFSYCATTKALYHSV